MIDSNTTYRAFAVSGCVLVVFIGLCHEFIGSILFPWGPAFLGGPVGWHGLGVFGISAGLLMLAGTLHVVRVPVATLSILVAATCASISAYTLIGRDQFHFLASVEVIAALAVFIFHRRAESTGLER